MLQSHEEKLPISKKKNNIVVNIIEHVIFIFLWNVLKEELRSKI